jgi:chromosome segregation ATPase
LRRSIEDDAKNAVLREKGLVEEIKSLKSQLAAKEKERIETVEVLHNMESRCISVGAKLETKIEDYDNLKKELEKVVREKNYVEKKSSEKDQNFYNKCNHLWSFTKIIMKNLERSLRILIGSLENLIYFLLGCVVSMKICRLLSRLALI